MGWTFEYGPRPLKNFIQDRIRTETIIINGIVSKTRTCIAHKYVKYSIGSGTLWAVWEIVQNGMPVERFVGLDLIKFSGGKHGGWGYKDLDACMGPNDMTCPLSYIDELVPDNAKMNRDELAWRADVRAYHANRIRIKRLLDTMRPGDGIYLKNWTDEYKLDSVRPLVVFYSGSRYRITKKDIDYERTLAAKQGIELEGT
jgi:hypothetical protein